MYKSTGAFKQHSQIRFFFHWASRLILYKTSSLQLTIMAMKGIFLVYLCEVWPRKPRLRPKGICRTDHATPLYLQKLALTSPTSGCRSVSIVRLRTKAMELVSFIFVFYISCHVSSEDVLCQKIEKDVEHWFIVGCEGLCLSFR
jgi:hypothetical protein